MNCLFQLKNAGMRYGTAEVLRSISLDLYGGEFLAIAGPNGAGKSTLLSLIAGLVTPTSGTCQFIDRDAAKWNRRNFARRVAMVQQTEPSSFPFTAEDVVYMGRMPHRSGMYESAEDHRAVKEALATTEMTELRRRSFRTLSGGEKQRILLASALAQSPEVLLLDEPATHLDLHHQIALHKLLRELSHRELLVIAVTHDLNLAAAYSSRMVLLHSGAVRADGTPCEVLRTQTIQEVFQVGVELHMRPSGTPWILYGE